MTSARIQDGKCINTRCTSKKEVRVKLKKKKQNSVLFLSSMEQAGAHKIDFPEFIMLLTQKHNSHHKGDKRQFVLEPNMNDHDRKTQVYSNPVFQQQSNFIKYL